MLESDIHSVYYYSFYWNITFLKNHCCFFIKYCQIKTLLHKSSFNKLGLIICINTGKTAIDYIGSFKPTQIWHSTHSFGNKTSFQLCPVIKRRVSYWIFVNNHVAMKIIVLMTSFQILEGSGRKKNVKVSVLLNKGIIYQVALSHK